MSKILVVDDHGDTRNPLVRLLQMEGYSVEGAADANEALAAAERLDPDLILLDLMIPPMDGLTFLSLLRGNPKNAQTPVIVVSGLSDAQTISKARELGVKEHLVKTQFTTEQLMGAIHQHIRGQRVGVPQQ